MPLQNRDGLAVKGAGEVTELEYKEFIYKRAETVRNQKDLSALIREITSYNHHYGTIIYGCMGAMKAAFNVVNRSPQGGISGWQAGYLGWECVMEFMSIKPPCRLQDFNNLLYPQYADSFEKTISMATWKDLQAKAAKNLENERKYASPNVMAHWKNIVAGEIPFGFQIKND